MKINVELVDNNRVEITEQQLEKVYDKYELTNEMRMTCNNYFKSDFVAHGSIGWLGSEEELVMEEVDWSVDMIKSGIEDNHTDRTLAYGKSIHHYMPSNNTMRVL